MGSFVDLKIVLVLTALCAVASSSRDELRKDLQQNYDKRVQPFNNGTTVALGLSPERMIEFDEINGKFAISTYLAVSWEDSRIAKNWANSSNQLPDIEAMYFSDSEVWTPRIIHVNSFSRFDDENLHESTVRFTVNGTASMLKREIFTSKCIVDFFKFPYETQTCSIELGLLGYNADDVSLISLHGVNLHYYVTDPTWNLGKVHARHVYFEVSGIMSKSIIYSFKLVRAASYFPVIVIMPMILMMHLQISCFFVPRKSGERTGLSMMVILSLAIYLIIVTDYIPQSSKFGVPFMVMFVFSGLVCSVFVHIVIIVSLHVPTENSDGCLIYRYLSAETNARIGKGEYDGTLGFVTYIVVFFMLYVIIFYYNLFLINAPNSSV
jgi:hypothetical protein